MIKTLRDCERIQLRRKHAGKRGYAKAVRRFVRRTEGSDYKAALGLLSVNWTKPEKKAA